MRAVLGTLIPLAIVALLWDLFARSGIYNQALTPPIAKIAQAGWQMILDGSLAHDMAYTLYRLCFGFVVAVALGVTLGMLMARVSLAERFFLPLASVLNPVPSLAWIPLFVLWFGLGNSATIALVAFAAVVPIMLNVWTGVKTVNGIWIRAAESMNCGGLRLFRYVVLPAAIPGIVSGLRIGFGRGWRAVVAGEMIAATQWGLGWVIFNSIAYLNTSVMLVGIVCIGVVGLVIETGVFSVLERGTVVKWGMMQEKGI
ncbi:MAG: ABC transporter permease [Nocardioidaceae bacterium]